MDFGVAAVDFQFLDPGGFLELGNVKSLHFNEYNME